ERDDVRVALHRQQLAVPPQRRGTHAQLLGLDGAVHAAEVVSHEERTAVARAGLLDRVELEVLATARALEMGRERRHAARSIFAPSFRRRSSSASYPRSI